MSIEVNKTERIVNVTVEKTYGKDGKSIEADIDIANQRVGFKQEGEANFTYIDLPKLEFDDLTQAQKDSLKLTFDQLTQAEKDSLKGSDANVTQENIESALPYNIARLSDLSSLDSRVVDLENTEEIKDKVFNYSEGDLQTFTVSDTSKYNACFVNGIKLIEFLEDGVTNNQWRRNSDTQFEILIDLFDGDIVVFTGGTKVNGGNAKYITDSLYTVDYSGLQQLVHNSDVQQGAGQGAWGFPVGTIVNFNEVSIYIGVDVNSNSPTKLKAIIKKIDYNGEVIAKTENTTLNLVTGKNYVTFNFENTIKDNGELWMEIHSDGDLGIFRSVDNTIFANDYPAIMYGPGNYEGETLNNSLGNYDVYAVFNKIQITKTEVGNVINKHQPLKGKSIAILGDSIIMKFSSQTENHDTQDWISLQDKLGVSELINCGIGGATWQDKGDQYNTSYPVKAESTGFISNECRMLQRLVSEGRTAPDCVIIAAGTNDGITNFGDTNSILSMPFADLEADQETRKTFSGGIRYSIELLLRNFPQSKILVATPLQTDETTSHRTYDAQASKADILRTICNRYSIPIIDALNESGITTYFESRYLNDGLHLNDAGKDLITNYFTLKIEGEYSQKTTI